MILQPNQHPLTLLLQTLVLLSELFHPLLEQFHDFRSGESQFGFVREGSLERRPQAGSAMLETGTIVDRFDGGGGKFDVGIVDLGEVGRGGLGREEEEEEGGFSEDHLA